MDHFCLTARKLMKLLHSSLVSSPCPAVFWEPLLSLISFSSPCHAFFSFFPSHLSLLFPSLQTAIQLAAGCHGTSCLQIRAHAWCVCACTWVCVCVAVSVITRLEVLHLRNLVVYSDSLPHHAGEYCRWKSSSSCKATSLISHKSHRWTEWAACQS